MEFLNNPTIGKIGLECCQSNGNCSECFNPDCNGICDPSCNAVCDCNALCTLCIVP